MKGMVITMKYGLQLYSLRDLTAKDMDAALRLTAEMGYVSVEFAGFGGHNPSEIADMLSKYSLRTAGIHSGVEGISLENIENTIALCKTIGCLDYVIPGADLSDSAAIDKFIGIVNYATPILEKNGIRLHFHNHASEFLPNKDGVVSHYELEKRTDILFEIDTYWAYVAGLDPVSTLKRLGDRVRLIHLKDGDKYGGGYSLGDGTAPVKDVMQIAGELGLTVVVESETLTPTGIDEVRRCIEFLRRSDKDFSDEKEI